MSNNKYIPVWISLAVAIGIIIGSLLNFNSNANGIFSSNNNQERKIKTLINYINNDYVDEVNTDSLLNNAIENIVGSLDPHSVYISPEELQQINDNMEGSFVGIGVQFMILKDTLNVTKTIQGGPSEKAGLLAGDRILKADETILYGDSLNNTLIRKVLKGEEGTSVALQIYRKRNDSLFTIDLKRGKVKLPSVDVAYMLNDTLGYIKINRFSNTTYEEFMQGLRKLENKGLQALVLDLRGNTGGYLHTTEAIVDEFLADDKLIVFTKNKRKIVDKSYATAKGDFEQGKLFVLIDEDSASASEILAGAIQDNDRGTIVGRRSFGKGLVQQQMNLGDGSAVRLTTSRYYTPTGRSIQKPYVKGHKEDYYKEAISRNYSGELLSKDSIKVVDSLKFTTPKGKIVYGGGGITPDVFVPLDQKGLHGISALMQYNLLSSFVYNYIDNNRNRLANLSAEAFVANDEIGNEIVHYFEKELSSKNLNSHFKLGKNPVLVRFIKALVARQLYGNEAYYRIISQDDNVIQKVLELN